MPQVRRPRPAAPPSSTPPRTPPWRRHPTFSFALLSTTLLLVIYGRALTAPFVYDDLDQVVNNPNLASLPAVAHRFLLHPVALTTTLLAVPGSIYRPVFWLSLWLDRALWGLNPVGFHATNLLLHLLNANLAFALLRRWGLPTLQAAAAALFWLVLPSQTEVVAWVSGRSYALCTLFLLLAFHTALAALRRRQPSPWFALFAVAALLAALSHELGLVLLPLLALSFPWVGHEHRQRWGLLVAVASTVAVTAVALRWRLAATSSASFAGLPGAANALAHLLAFALFPLHLSLERSTTLAQGALHPGCLAAGLLFVAGWFYALRQRQGQPGLLLALGWFTVAVSPFCLVHNYQGVAERFCYLGSLGLATALALLCLGPHRPPLRRPLQIVFAAWAIFFAVRTAWRVADWTDPVRLYASSLRATPTSPLLHFNLAYALRQDGDFAAAVPESREVLALAPRYPQAWASLGDAYLGLHAFGQAQGAYQHALQQTPNDTAIWLNSGAAAQGSGDLPIAEAAFTRVLALDPTRTAAHVDLGNLYLRENRSNDAAHQFALAIDSKTDDPVPFFNLGVLLQKSGRPDLALVLYRKALALNPADPDTLNAIRAAEAAQTGPNTP